MIPNIDQPRLRLRNGVWHLRKQHQKKRFELSLGTSDRAIAAERARNILMSMVREHVSATWAETVRDGMKNRSAWLWRLQISASARGKSACVSIAELEEIALRSGGRCMVSGIPFMLGHKFHPYQPSLDRIVAGQSYAASNCRLVCLAVNFCMHRWGEDTFRSLALAVATRHLELLSQAHLIGGDSAGLALNGKQSLLAKVPSKIVAESMVPGA